MNYFDEDDGTEFRDTPDEVEGQDAPPVSVRSVPQQRPQVQQQAPVQQPVEQYEEEAPEVEEEEDFTEILNDARLRLEQGKLYEMLMNHDIFEGMDADQRAVKSVQREIRKFAQDRMELMLGMKQPEAPAPQSAFPAEAFPFNTLEVEVLKSLAAAATKGASREAEAFVPEVAPAEPKRTTLKPIAIPANRTAVPKPVAKAAQPAARKPLPAKPAAPVKRQKVDERIQKILQEEGVTLEEINATFPPDYKPLDPAFTENLSPEEIARRNADSKRRLQKTVPSPTAAPMPDQEQINAMYTNRVQTASANPQMQTIMHLLLNNQVKK